MTERELEERRKRIAARKAQEADTGRTSRSASDSNIATNRARSFTVGRDGTHKETLLEKLLRTKAELENKRQNYYKSKSGLNQVRIMPSWRGPDEVFHLYVPNHKGIGPNNRYVTCLQFWGDHCPIDDYIDKLNESTLASDLNIAAKMAAKTDVLVNVGVPNAPDGFIKPWSMSESFWLDILAGLVDPDTQDFTNPRTGYDFLFTRVGTGQYDTKYSDKHFARQPSKIAIDDWRAKLIDLDKFVKPRTRQEIRALLRGED